MIKMILCLVILAGGGGAGWLKAYSYSLRVRDLEDLETVLKILRAEMEYSLTPLPQLLIQTGSRRDTPCCAMLRRAGELLLSGECHTLGESWKNAIDQVYGEGSLTKEDASVVAELGLELGKTDMAGQKSCFERTFHRLAQQLAEAEQEKAAKGRMYRGLGLCVSLMAAIILL